MLDVTEQLRRYADVVAAAVEPVAPEEVGAPRIGAGAARRASRRTPFVVAAAGFALVLLGGALIWTATSPDRAGRRGTSPSAVGPAVEDLAPWPLEARSDVAMVWTGREVVVWGGDVEALNERVPGPDQVFADGAAFDPATGRWRRMAPGPLPATTDIPRAAAVDGVVVIVRGSDAAAWDPHTDTWRPLDDVRRPVSQLVVAGDRVVSVATDAAGDLAGVEELDLERGTWRARRPPPLALGRPTAAWDGAEIVILGQRTFSESGALAYDPSTATWRELDPPSMLNPASLSATRAGDRVVFVDYEMGVAAHRRGADGWDALPLVPAHFYEDIPLVEAVGPTLVVRTGGALVMRTGDQPWIPLPLDTFGLWSWYSVVAPDHAADRDRLFVFGRAPGGATRFLAVDPDRLAAEARVLQVGVAQVDVPDGFELTASSYDQTRGQEVVRVRLGTPRGPCTMTSEHRPIVLPTTPWAATDASGTTWAADATESDRVEVTCTDAEMARTLTAATPLPPPPPYPVAAPTPAP